MRRTLRYFVQISRQALLLAVAGTAMILASPTAAVAQCTLNKATVDRSGTDYLSMQASTTQAGCGQRETWVEAWIAGHGTECLTGTPSGTLCKKVTFGQTATETIGASDCGPGTGYSNHKAWGPYQEIAIGFPTPLLAPCYDPAAECAALGADYYWNGGECVYTPGSPIVIAPFKKTEYEFTSSKDGVYFDIDGDGVVDQVAWTLADSEVAFLALDRNGDGVINNGTELFGNHTRAGARNGFQALSSMAMDSNGGILRGSVSSDDPIFAKLLLWTDKNHNGISEPAELRPASELLSDIGLSYGLRKIQDEFGNIFAYRGWAHVRTKPGRNRVKTSDEDNERTIHIWDVYLKIDGR